MISSFLVAVAPVVGIYVVATDPSSNCAPNIYNQLTQSPVILPERPVVFVGTWLICMRLLVATSVFVIATHLYIQGNPATASIEPVHSELAHIVPVNKSKFIYPFDIAHEVRSCRYPFSPAFAYTV